MVAPLTPYDDLRYSSKDGFKRIVGFRQKRPYDVVTPVTSEVAWASSSDGSHNARSWSWGYPNSYAVVQRGDIMTSCRNAAYKKLVNRLGESMSFGSTITAEGRKTAFMLHSTVLRCAAAALAIKRFNFGRAAQLLGLPYRERTIRVVLRRGKKRRAKLRWVRKQKRGKPSVTKTVIVRRRVFTLPSGREVLKTLSNGWLFYSYGVKPLAEDIYNGLDFLQRPFKDGKQKGKSSENFSHVTVTNDYAGNPLSQPYSTVRTWSGKVVVRQSAKFAVINPNLWLLSRMGLTNPVEWIIEAIPFSFVVDWFTNLREVVASWKELDGLLITDATTSALHVNTESFIVSGPSGYHRTNTKTRVVYRREVGLTLPRFHVKYERFEIQRGLNAISLLVGFLPRKSWTPFTSK